MSTVKGNKASSLRKASQAKINYKQREMKKLDIDNKQMEWRLHQLKQTMEKEKKDRSQVGNIWQSAKTRNVDVPSKMLTKNKSLRKGNGSIRPKTEGSRKISVLKDEPLEVPITKSKYADLINKLQAEDPGLSKTVPDKSPENYEDRQTWISLARHRHSDEVMEVQSDRNGNLPLSSVRSFDPNAIGLFFVKWGRKRILPAVDGNVLRPKVGWGTDTYYPYVTGASLQEQANPVLDFNLFKKVQSPKEPGTKIPKEDFESSRTPRHQDSPRTGGLLFKGEFNEEESANSFQQALKQWRKSPKKSTSELLNFEENRFPEQSAHAVQSDPLLEVDIKFTETSTLTYMEKILLKKHRASSVPPLSSFSHRYNGGDNYDDDDDQLTAEDIEERERIRSIFSFEPSSHDRSYLKPSLSIVALNDDYDVTPADNESSNCIVQPPTSTTSKKTVQSKSGVKIEELNYGGPSSAVKVDAEVIKHEGSAEQKLEGVHKGSLSKLAQNKGLLSAVSSLGVDPTAAYNHGSLGSFFTGESAATDAAAGDALSTLTIRPRAMLDSKEMITSKGAHGSWQPSTSIHVSSQHQFSHSAHVPSRRSCSRLEGNVNSEGRISRLIDEWSSEDEAKLGIINDPGTCSVLTTPDVEKFKWADNHNPLDDSVSSLSGNNSTLLNSQQIDKYVLEEADDNKYEDH